MTSASQRPSEFPVHLDRAAEASLPAQLTSALRDAIDGGTLQPGEKVMPTRELARRLGVARGVVVAAYEQLTAEGYLAAGHGRGTVVHPELEKIRGVQPVPGARAPFVVGSASADPGSPVARATQAPRTGPVLHAAPQARSAAEPSSPRSAKPGPLAPGVPITDAVDRPAWRAAWRAAAMQADAVAPALGDPRLRFEIADHLRRMRGTARPATDIIVTAGAREGLGLLLTALGATAGRQLAVGVEDPGYPSLRGVATRHGAQVIALPVDSDGLDVDALPTGVLDIVIVTPSHQYPLGGSLPLPRRLELLAWARRTGAVVVEDDYDSELRHTGSPLPALAALDDAESGAVVTIGTFSKTVAPALATGFLLAPARLRALIEPVRVELGGPVSSVVQGALAGYLASGELRRHMARMRRRYAVRRERVSEVLGGTCGVQVRPMSGGLHAVLEFGSGPLAREREERAVARAALLGAAPLGEYWQQRDRTTGLAGLVIGTGGADEPEFEGALEALQRILAAR